MNTVCDLNELRTLTAKRKATYGHVISANWGFTRRRTLPLSPSISSLPYVKGSSPAGLIKQPTRSAQIALTESVPVIKFPHHTTAPPSALHCFPPAPGHRSKWIPARKARLCQRVLHATGLARIQPTNIDLVCPLHNIPQRQLTDSMQCRPADIN